MCTAKNDGKKLGESGGLEYSIFGLLLSSILTAREAPRGEGTLNILFSVMFPSCVQNRLFFKLRLYTYWE